jgi:O-succinylhomoserine sulfhydrylase
MAQQSNCGGAVLSFEIKAAEDADQARRGRSSVLDSLQTLSLCTNLGDTKTLLAHPASTSHGRLTERNASWRVWGRG